MWEASIIPIRPADGKAGADLTRINNISPAPGRLLKIAAAAPIYSRRQC